MRLPRFRRTRAAALSRATGTAAVVAVAVAAAPLLATATHSPAPAQRPAAVPVTTSAATGYQWQNAQIHGGGFVPGIVYNPGEPGLVYARTDIGGAYRWDHGTDRWKPLLDWVGWDRWGWTGVASLAADPVDTDRVYAAVGTYTNDWDPGNGAILRSADRGDTWQVTELPFKLGGNMPGRGMGERLAVDPNDGRVVYFGAPSGQGLWRSTDAGATFRKVDSLTNPGSYADLPGDPSGYQSDAQGIVWVTFDPASGRPGSLTRTIYAGVADPQNPVYRSTDAGATWQPVAGGPKGFIPHKGVLDADGSSLYVALSDKAGPYDGQRGDVWRLDTTTSTWTRISPAPSTDPDSNWFGYSGLTVDRQRPGTLMVTAYSLWWPDTQIYRSTDGGDTWTTAWEFTSYPERGFRYRMDVSSSPWLTFGNHPQPPEVTPKLGWMTEALEIDPFDSDRMMYGTGATVYGTDDLTTWDAGGQITIEPMARGIEETAVLDLISPPSGPPLVSALGDIDGFRHDDLTKVPALMHTSPRYASSTSLDYAETSPNIMVRAGDADSGSQQQINRVAFSTDGGAHWFQASSEPGGVTGGGTVAAAADGSRFVWSPQGAQPSLSVGFGHSWTPAQGLPQGAVVESDRVDPTVFYGVAGGRFYRSTDGGATFTATPATGLPDGQVRFKAVPGRTGDVWVAGGTTGGTYGLWHSTDAGTSFTRVDAFDAADTIGFGKAAPGRDYPALYSSASADGVRGIYRSDDAGATWVRINDDANQWAWTGSTITGDPRVYGRVYVGTNGRGIVYGDLVGTPGPTPTATPTTTPTTTPTVVPTVTPTVPTPTDTPEPTDTPDPTSTPTPTGTATPTATPTSQPGAGTCLVSYDVAGEWPGGFLAQVLVTNTGDRSVDGWTLEWSFPDGQQVASMWGAAATNAGGTVSATAADWNRTIAPGASASFGFIGSTTGANGTPAAFSLDGSACALA